MVDIKVVNIVASATFAEKLDLDMIVQSPEETEYEPEQFPGFPKESRFNLSRRIIQRIDGKKWN